MTPTLLRALAIGGLLVVEMALCALQIPDQKEPWASFDRPAPEARPDTPRRDLVFAVQAELALRGFDPGPLDGIPGGKTEAAIADYQHLRSAPADVRPTEDLLRSLQRWH